MSESFKIETMFLLNQKQNFGANKRKNVNNVQQNFQNSSLSFNMKSASVFKYDVQTLIQIISLIFDLQDVSISPPYKQIQKGLKIISFSSNDQNVKSKINNLLAKNLHKKKQAYLLFCLWTRFDRLINIMNMFEDKVKISVSSILIQTFLSHSAGDLDWFEKFSLKRQIFTLFEFITKQSGSRLWAEIQMQLSYQQCKTCEQLQTKLLKLILLITQTNENQDKRSKNEANQNLRKLLAIQIEMNPAMIRKIVEKSLLDISKSKSSIFESICVDIFFTSTSQETKKIEQMIEKLIHSNLDVFEKQNKAIILDIIFHSFGLRQSTLDEVCLKYLQQNIKTWLLSSNYQKLFSIVHEYYSMFKIFSNQQKCIQLNSQRNNILSVISKISGADENVEENIKRAFLTNYFYHFFQGKPINFFEELNYLEKSNHQQNGFLKFEKQNLSKGLKNIRNQKRLNIMIFNKSNFFSVLSTWNVDDSFQSLLKKNELNNNGPLKKLLKNVEQYWNVIAEKMLKDNKRLELNFSVIKLEIDNQNYFVTFNQLLEFLTNYSTCKKDIQLQSNEYQKEYSPFVTSDKIVKSALIQKSENDHPIILEAKIIKLMKRQLKRATCQEISTYLKLQLQKTQQIVKKLVSKGYLLEKQGQTYEYEP